MIGEHPSDLVRDQYLMEVAVALPHRARSAAGRHLAPAADGAGRGRPDGAGPCGRRRAARRRPDGRPDSPEIEALRLLIDRSRR